MKIIDLKCAVIGENPVVRIVSDAAINGHGEVESRKPYPKPFVLHPRPAILGEEPTNVESAVRKIRNRGASNGEGAP
jgi:L-alanine-DL-glutamate epimerase-like enolase superfamily enzyme